MNRKSWPPNLVGAGWIFVSALTFTVMMTLVKFLGTGYPAAVQSAYRQMASLAFMVPIVARQRSAILSTSRPVLLLCTMALSTVSLVLSLYSYQMLHFAEANALSFTRTLWLVPLANLILKEPIGWVRGGAIALGFAGTMVMLNPGGGGVGKGLNELAALAAALTAAGVIICMKTLTRDHKLLTVMAWSAVAGFIFSIIPALFVWRWPSLFDLLLLSAMGVMGVCTQASYIKGLSMGQVAAVAPVDYVRLPLTALFGWLLFQERPESTALLGGGIVIVSTLIISWQEFRAYKMAAAILTSTE